ncbi:hypothetical protein BGW39_001104 [Mortierella sp. 14UC]|nr:hypothetical protein BGW39_001104 [Mortierella sp. 14UC]
MDPSSPPAAGEEPNICIRFWLGPNNLGILRPHLDVMEEHPVVIEQRDFRFDVYGRPANVANAIAYSFLRPTSNTDDAAQGNTTAADTSPEYRRSSSTPLSSVEHPGKDQQEGDMAAAGRFGAQRTRNDDAGSKLGYRANKTNLSTPSSTKPTSPPEATVATADIVPQRSFTADPANRKTDYDLAFEHLYGTLNDKEQAATEIREPKPWSVSILLSMPFRVVQYLMLMSHGFRTYLVEEPNLDSCGRQGISQERLNVIAKSAGLVVAINNIQLPRLVSNPEESPVWLQTDDRKALRAVLLGVGKALAQEPVRGVIQKGLGQEEVTLRKSWDGILGQTTTSGTTPNEREWVMDNRASQQDNVRPADSIRWAEVDRARWDSRSMVVWDPWTTTTSQSVGSFFTESESHGPEASTGGRRIGTGDNNRDLSEDNQGSGQSSRSTSSQEVHWIAAQDPRRYDDNKDPWAAVVAAPSEER